MLIKTIFSGFGGQGVLFMGYCLATAAMEEGHYTTYLPSYGAEVRGGTANCTVAVSDEPIASPVASEPNFIVALNNPSFARFQSHLVRKGLFFVNSDLVDLAPTRTDVTFIHVPAGTLANQTGNPRGANMVMLGSFIKQTGLIGLECMAEVISTLFAEKSAKLVEPNLAALSAGYQWETL